MPVSPLDALKNAALLKGLASPTNVAAQFDLPDDTGGLPEGLGPGTSGLRLSGTAQPERIAAVLNGGSPALRAAQDAVRVKQYTDAAHLNDLGTGVPEELAIGDQRVRNAGADEAAAGAFMPYTEQLYNRTQGDKTNLANMQYVLPSVLKSQADLQGHQIDTQGRLAAAQAGHPDKQPLDYMLDALRGAAAKGIILQPNDIATLKQQFGVK